jgi:hypothetical protein
MFRPFLNMAGAAGQAGAGQPAALPLPQVSTALPAPESGLPARELADMIQKLRLEAGQKGEKPAG